MGQETGDMLDNLTRKVFTSPRLSLSLDWFTLQMMSTNTSGEEGDKVELEPLNPPVPTETVISKYSPVVTDSAGLKFEGS